MSENIKMEDLVEKTDVTSESAEEVVETTTEQDPLKTELERVRQKDPKAELEKARKALFFNAKRLEELGGDPRDVLKEKQEEEGYEDSDDAPVTLGMLRKMQAETATKTALDLTNDITDESERELTKYHLQNSIKPTGNPQEDYRIARAITNSVRNSQILEEATRKSTSRSHSGSSSAPLKFEAEQPELTREEIALMKFGHLTKEDVLKARK